MENKPPEQISCNPQSCDQCRKLKKKCDGVRSVCGRCTKAKNYSCSYSSKKRNPTSISSVKSITGVPGRGKEDGYVHCCDQCRKKKKKCDGVRPHCGRCASSKHDDCNYSLKRNNFPNTQIKTVKNNYFYSTVKEPCSCVIASRPSEMSLVYLNPSFLSAYMNFFQDAFPIVSLVDINCAIDLLYQGKWELSLSESTTRNIRECAYFSSLWTCLATGALLQGSEIDSKMYSMKAILARSLLDSDNFCSEDSLSTICRADLQLALYHQLTGDFQKTNNYFKKAVKLGSEVKELQGVLKVLQDTTNQVSLKSNLTSFFISEAELDGFTCDSKIFFKWDIPVFSAVFLEVGDWDMKHDCYRDLLEAEQYLQTKLDRSPLNWARIQFLMMVLEFGYLGLFSIGLQRARDLTQLFQQIMTNYRYPSKAFFQLLELLAYIFHQTQDHKHFVIIRYVWNSIHKTGEEKHLPELFNLQWDEFTNDPIRIALRARIQRVCFQPSSHLPTTSEKAQNLNGAFSVDDDIFISFFDEDNLVFDCHDQSDNVQCLSFSDQDSFQFIP